MADKSKWKYSEGFIVGAVLFIAGVLIQALAGPVRWTAVAMPLNLLIPASWPSCWASASCCGRSTDGSDG